jgi:hypothetical protein
MTLLEIEDATKGSPLQSVRRLNLLFRRAQMEGDELGAESVLLVALAIIDENELVVRGLVGGFSWLVARGATRQTRRQIRAYATRLRSHRLLQRLESTKAVPVALEPHVAAAIAEAEAEAAMRDAGAK